MDDRRRRRCLTTPLTFALALGLAPTPLACGGGPRPTAGPDPGGAGAGGAPAALDAPPGAGDPTLPPHGRLALVPVDPAGAATPEWGWLPTRTAELSPGVVVVETTPGGGAAVGAGASATAIGPGGAFAASLADEVTVPYGCDGGTHRFVRWRTDPGVGAGVVWLRPPGPEANATRAVPLDPQLATSGRRTSQLRVDPPVEISLTVAGAGRAWLEVRRGGAELHTRLVERAVMDGDPEANRPLDLRAPVPGLPAPLAAFTSGQPGEVLLVFATPGYEGVSISAMFLGQRGAVDADLGFYLYQCAY